MVFGALGVVMVFIRFRWREKFDRIGRVPPPDPAHARQFAALPDEDHDLVLRCGAKVNLLDVKSPYAGLWWVRAPFGRALRFRTASGRLDKVTVWPPGKTESRLAELGWR